MNPNENRTIGERIRRSKYGLGDRRTFDQLMEFSGVDPVHQRTLRDRCGNIDYVPFHEHPLGPDYIPSFDPVTFDPLDEPDEGSIYYQPPLAVSPLVGGSSGEGKMIRTPEEKEKLFEKRKYLLQERRQREEEKRADHPESPPLLSVGGGARIALRAEKTKEQLVVATGGERSEAGGGDVNENIWRDISVELLLFFIIMLSCYYCTCTVMPIPVRATKKL
jgi:hypothetical protein